MTNHATVLAVLTFTCNENPPPYICANTVCVPPDGPFVVFKFACVAFPEHASCVKDGYEPPLYVSKKHMIIPLLVIEVPVIVTNPLVPTAIV